MSADQIAIVLVVLVVVLVANLAIMLAVVIGGSRRRQAAPAGDPVAAVSPAPGPGAPPSPPTQAASSDPVDAPAIDDDALRALLVDRTTGLDSRLAWERILRDEDARQARYGRPVTVAILEIEGLERVVARLGPDAADRILVAVAGTIRANARTSDRAAALAPGRFGVLLPETDEVQAVNFVERVRNVCSLWLDASGASARALFGWASPGPGVDLRTARRLAEERLDRERRQSPPPHPGGNGRGRTTPDRDGEHAEGAGPEPVDGGTGPTPEARAY
jgi:diguanylate cyclase (GGDEF)-like protein